MIDFVKDQILCDMFVKHKILSHMYLEEPNIFNLSANSGYLIIGTGKKIKIPITLKNKCINAPWMVFLNVSLPL